MYSRRHDLCQLIIASRWFLHSSFIDFITSSCSSSCRLYSSSLLSSTSLSPTSIYWFPAELPLRAELVVFPAWLRCAAAKRQSERAKSDVASSASRWPLIEQLSRCKTTSSAKYLTKTPLITTDHRPTRVLYPKTHNNSLCHHAAKHSLRVDLLIDFVSFLSLNDWIYKCFMLHVSLLG